MEKTLIRCAICHTTTLLHYANTLDEVQERKAKLCWIKISFDELSNSFCFILLPRTYRKIQKSTYSILLHSSFSFNSKKKNLPLFIQRFSFPLKIVNARPISGL